MIEKIIHFSVGESLSKLQNSCIERAKSLHPDWDIKVWRDPLNPEDFELAHYWSKVNSGAQLSDLIRLELIQKYGGIYLDSDVLLEKPLTDLLKCDQLIIGTEDGHRLTNAVFGAPAKNQVLREIIEELKNNEPDWSIPPNITTGPQLFTRMLFWRKDSYYLLPPIVFYPNEAHEFNKTPSYLTLGTHLWAASWKPLGLNRIRSFLARRKHHLSLILKRIRLLITTNYILNRLRRKVDAFSMSGLIMRRSVHNYYVTLVGNDLSVTPEFVRNGYYELSDEIFVIRNLRPGDYFVDVGANVGIYTLLAARNVGDFGRVIAFEPNPQLADLIEQSAVANWTHNRIRVERAGVAEKAGKLKLQFSNNSLGGASFVNLSSDIGFQDVTRSLAGDLKEVQANVISLDQYFIIPHQIKFLKIDAEGFEANVLRGARRLIQERMITFIVMEVITDINPNSWASLRDEIVFLYECGYKSYIINRFGTLKRIPANTLLSGNARFGRNIVFSVDK